ncbi:MAG TPA: TonB-dependent receptor [Longimicrobiales bacterium]
MFAPLAMAVFALIGPLQQLQPEPGTVRGIVRSEATGERLAYSVIEVAGSRTLVTMADSMGRYLLRNVPPGRRLLRVSRFDHSPLEIEVLIPSGGSIALDVMLVRRPVALPGIVANVSPRPSLADTVNPPPAELSAAITRAIESTPGVIEVGLGQVSPTVPGREPIDPSDVLYVRGAPADLKLVLLDGAPVYAPFHLGGLIQAFDPELLRSADLYLGGAPARYDGGLSYVLGLETRAGRRTGFASSGSADLLSTRVLVEGPITRRAGFLVGGRAIHSWGAEWLLDQRFPYDYADVVARLDADLGVTGSVALTGFWNHESVRLDGTSLPDDIARWGNRAASLRYRGSVAGMDADLTVAYGDYGARLPLGGERDVHADGRAQRTRVTADLTRRWETTRLQFGASYENLALIYRARPGAVRSMAALLETETEGAVMGTYVDLGWAPADRWRIRGGIRADVFSSDAMVRFAPRLSVTWLASERAAVTIAAGRYRQLLRSTEPALVMQDDATASLYVPPPMSVARASHVVVSLDQELGEGVRLGIEGYYKRFDDVPRADTALVEPGPLPVQTTRTDAARASGIDVWLRRGEGRLTGWLGYSLGWVWAADGPPGTDRFAGRQILSIGLAGPIGRYGAFDLRVAYGAGLPYAAIPRVELQDGYALLDTRSAASLAEFERVTINAPPLTAMPDDPYFRVDLEVSRPWTGEWRGRPVTFTPYLKVLNALDRRDALFYTVIGEEDEPDPLAVLPILPVLGFRWKF